MSVLPSVAIASRRAEHDRPGRPREASACEREREGREEVRDHRRPDLGGGDRDLRHREQAEDERERKRPVRALEHPLSLLRGPRGDLGELVDGVALRGAHRAIVAVAASIRVVRGGEIRPPPRG